MAVEITLLYAGALGLLFLGESLNIIRLRWKYRVGILGGSQRELELAVRAHANFAEYVPLILILMGLLELQGSSSPLIYTMGGCLFLGRILHFWGLSRSAGTSPGRFSGMILTFISLLMGSVLAIMQFFS